MKIVYWKFNETIFKSANDLKTSWKINLKRDNETHEAVGVCFEWIVIAMNHQQIGLSCLGEAIYIKGNLPDLWFRKLELLWQLSLKEFTQIIQFELKLLHQEIPPFEFDISGNSLDEVYRELNATADGSTNDYVK